MQGERAYAQAQGADKGCYCLLVHGFPIGWLRPVGYRWVATYQTISKHSMKPEAFVNEPYLIPHHGTCPDVANDVFIADTARVIGDVVLGEGTSVWYGAVIRGDVFHIRIGRRVNIQDLTMVHVTTDRYATVIEDDVTVGHRAILHGCTIKRGALIGMGAIVMDGAVVGEGAMIAAGALVTPKTEVAPNTLWIGSPARMKRPLSEEEQAHLAQSAEHYYNLSQTYRTQGLGRSRGEA